ncbi:hypothetical protein Tamer19_06800 [Cupriavidus sp. TA19]|nr:hypothetical protein [Cupriavidus sp. P-10]GLC91272.1 hypothetical protein Tamer19_06800 [Cupriavidus sp. TA19]
MEEDVDIAGADHSVHSVLRERIVEHLFVGQVLQRLWQRGVTDVEVLRSEFDAGGYDLVMNYGNIVRHVQLKVSVVGAATSKITASLKLQERPSGCVLWIVVRQCLSIESYRWYGDLPGRPLPSIRDMKVAKHSRADSTGQKGERPNQRVLPISGFQRIHSLDELLKMLLGVPLPSTSAEVRTSAA